MFRESVIVGHPLQTIRRADGKRELSRDLEVDVEGRRIKVPAKFVTDYSSYPRVLFTVGLILVAYSYQLSPVFFLPLLLIPKFSRVDVAGVVHDRFYETAEVSKWRADKIWYQVARSGEQHAYPWQAVPTWLVGLVIWGWPGWLMHRWKQREGMDAVW